MSDAGAGPGTAPGTAPGTVPAPTAAPARPSLAHIGGLVLRSAVLPGSAHLATGHRRSGRLLLGLTALGVAGLVAFLVVAYVSPPTVAGLAVRPTWLLALQWGAPLLALGWVGVLVSAAVLARPGSRGAAGRLLAGGLVVVLAAAVAVPAAVATRYASVQRGFLSDVFGDDGSASTGGTSAQAPLANGRLNVLLVGSDAGPDRTGTRTDTVILASVDTRTGRTVLFSLPRNLEQVPFAPGSVMAARFPRGWSCGDGCLLNSIYGWAVDHPDLFPGDPDPGMTALRSAVTAALGQPVDYQVTVDLAGFAAVVDALGGVDIRVERRLPIGGLDADGNRVRPAGYIEPGLQHMSGATALAYARSRSDSTDYERVQRQRCLLGALQRSADPGTLLTNFQQLASSTADAVQTDLPRSLLPDLVTLAFRVKERPLESLTFTPPLVDVVEPDYPAIRAAVRAALAGPPPTATPGTPTTPPAPATSGAPTTSPGPTRGVPAPSTPSAPPSAAPDSTPVSVEQVCAYE